MRKIIEAYASFNRTERLGLIGLLTILIILVILRSTMHLWVKPKEDIAGEQKLAKAWDAYKQNAVSDTGETRKYYDHTDGSATILLPDTVNINTADSATLVALKGIGPVTAHKIIEYRKSIGRFTSADQLKEIGHIRKSTIEELKEHLKFK